MKRGTILNPELSRVVAALGHGDAVVVADAGLPIPPGVARIDLAFAPGKPRFMEVLEALLARLLALPKVKARGVELVPHEELKRRSGGARAVVRTGEFTPYANVILYAGVVF